MKLKPAKISITLFAIGLLVILGVSAFFVFQKQSSTKISSETLVYFNNGQEVNKLSHLNETGLPLPEELIIRPGIYQIGNRAYNLNQEGLYRILAIPEENHQRIVYKEDAKALLSALSWIDIHGTLDNDSVNAKLKKKALKEKIVLTCGKISAFTQEILREKGIQSRLIMGLTKGELTGYDDSHVMVEVKIGDKWQVFDIDNNATFKKGGEYLNYRDLAKLIESGDFEIERIAADPIISDQGFEDKQTGYDFSLYAEEINHSDASLKTWYKKVLAIPAIREGKTYFFLNGDEKAVSNFDKSMKKLSEEEFGKKFY